MTFLVSLIFSSYFMHAQVGATSDSLGGTGVANLNGIESAFLNPAGLAFFKDVHFGGAYRFGKTSLGEVRQMNAVIADATEGNFFAGSLAYRQREYEPSSLVNIDEKQFIVNGAFLLQPHFAVGLRAYKIQTDFTDVSKTDQYNGDLGVHYVINESLALAATQTGLLSTEEGLIAPLGVLPETKLGALFEVNSFITFLADFGFAYNQNPNKRFSHAVGMVLTKMEFFKLHVGGRLDDRSGEAAYTAGFQFYGPKLKLGYAYQKEVRQELGEVHTIDISLNL